MALGLFNPNTKEVLTIPPAVVYSPIVPLPPFVTNIFDPDTARLHGSSNPDTKDGFTIVPSRSYSPMELVPTFVT
jgi:hypothetical protein